MTDIVSVDAVTNKATINLPYPLKYTVPFLKGVYFHDEMAAVLSEKIKAGKPIRTCMIVIEDETLADEHWDDPKYMHKTNNLIICEARQEVRRNMIANKYFNRDELKEFMEKNDLLSWKYNYQEQDEKERKFQFVIEDAIFDYQETVEMVKHVESYLENAQFKLDEHGYPIEKEYSEEKPKEVSCFTEEVTIDESEDEEDNDYIFEKDPAVIEAQRELILHRLLKPQVRTTHERVYDLPEPFNYWDSRSFWHQFFIVIDEDAKELYYARGNTGSSGAREDNGRWAHTFAQLANVHGIETPTYHLLYNSHNELNLVAKHNEFKAMHYDLSGNYQSTHDVVDSLFEGRLLQCVRTFHF